MSMLYVYGIVDAPEIGIGLRGHADAAVHAVSCGDLAAAVSPLDGEAAPRPDNVWRHEQVLQALMATHAVLPARFGTLVHDAATLHAQLLERYTTLAAALARLRGRVEFALGATVTGEGPTRSTAAAVGEKPPCASGSAYLRAKAARLHELAAREGAAKTVEDLLRRQLDAYASEVAWHIVLDVETRLTASYLVDLDEAGPFRAAVERARGCHPALDITCTGPWAPYSFADLDRAEAWS